MVDDNHDVEVERGDDQDPSTAAGGASRDKGNTEINTAEDNYDVGANRTVMGGG